MHVEVLLALGHRDQAAATLATYAKMVAECQTPHFTTIVEQLKARLRQ